MQDYRTTFPKRHTLLVVVHAENTDQVLRNIAVAQSNGADGVFLINHRITPNHLVTIYCTARIRFPDVWMGMNLLGLTPREALECTMDYGGLWTDHAGIVNADVSGALEFEKHRRTQSSWKGLYFGGVAFKYQQPVTDVALTAKSSMKFVDVITTSGSGTGSAPDPNKIRLMREAVGHHPIAIASGITPENVRLFMDWADCFMVATGISDSHTELNPKRVAELAKAISST